MQTLEYRTIDKSDWPRGEWDDEPDKRQWQDEATGLPCLLVRSPGGHLCGYVGVSEGHPLYRLDDSHSDFPCLDCHGGVTFTGACQPSDDGESRGICHVPGDGEPDHVWWIGFDCAHSGDFYSLAIASANRLFEQSSYETYRTAGYVAQQCRELARQLAELQVTT